MKTGKAFFMQIWQDPADLELTSDAASTCGCSDILSNCWSALRWQVDITLPHIAVLELIPIVLAASLSAKYLSGQRVLFQCDNSAAVEVGQKCNSKNSHLLKLLKYMAYFAVKFNFNFSAVHVEGKLNPKADALSRFRFQVFREFYSVSRRRGNRYRPFIAQRPTLSALDSHLSAGLAKSTTHLTYPSGQRLFMDFRLDFGTLNVDDSILPASEITLLRFNSHLSSRDYKPLTIKGYLSAVRSLHVLVTL